MHNESNENGLKAMDFAISMDMKISTTFFPKKRIHKETWISLDGSKRNQIDHITIDRRHGLDITDVKICRAADYDSDHFLLESSTNRG
jgi:hypothetical protein